MNKINVIDSGTAISMYLDWFNNFLTLPRFAEYYGISESFAKNIIDRGREVLNGQHYSDYYKITVKVK